MSIYTNQSEYDELCKAMGEPDGIPMGFLADIMLSNLSREIVLDPVKIEMFIKRKKGVSTHEGQSIADLVTKIYGREVRRKMMDLM